MKVKLTRNSIKLTTTMKNLSKFAFVALTALTFAFTSCGNSGTKQEGEATSTEGTATEGSDAMTTDTAAAATTDTTSAAGAGAAATDTASAQ